MTVLKSQVAIEVSRNANNQMSSSSNNYGAITKPGVVNVKPFGSIDHSKFDPILGPSTKRDSKDSASIDLHTLQNKIMSKKNLSR